MVDLKTLSQVKGATISLFTGQWQKNFNDNRDKILNNPGVKALGNKFAGVPSIVVGAGPSLDKNLKYLKYAPKRALIIACDASCKTLLAESITPDFVTMLDPQPEISRFFEGINTRNLTLIAPTIAHPDVLKQWNGRIVFYNKFAPDIPVLVQIQKSVPHVGELIPGGTVLSISYSLAFQAGANPITFVGQDLSYPKGKTYTKGSVYEEQTKEDTVYEQKDNIVHDIDMFGKPIETLKSMFVTKQWLEWAFTTWKRQSPVTVMNSSEGGILRNKCLVAPLNQFLHTFCSQTYNFSWKIQKLLKQKK